VYVNLQMLEAYEVLVKLTQAALASTTKENSPATPPLLALLSEAMQLKAGALSQQLTEAGKKEAAKKLQVS